MKTNKIMRLASFLLIAVVLSTCAISGTFAKYTTTTSGSDTARVAKWGFTADDNSIVLTDLFTTAYTNDSGMNAAADAIAPGTTNSTTFAFEFEGASGIAAPEVAYSFEIDLTGTAIADDLKNNANITWTLDSQTGLTWDAFVTALLKLACNGEDTPTAAEVTALKIVRNYAPGEIPAAFDDATDHTVGWNWAFTDTNESALGNKTTLDTVTVAIKVTATQLDAAAQ